MCDLITCLFIYEYNLTEIASKYVQFDNLKVSKCAFKNGLTICPIKEWIAKHNGESRHLMAIKIWSIYTEKFLSLC